MFSVWDPDEKTLYIRQELVREALRRRLLFIEFMDSNPDYQHPTFAHRILLEDGHIFFWLDDRQRLRIARPGNDGAALYMITGG